MIYVQVYIVKLTSQGYTLNYMIFSHPVVGNDKLIMQFTITSNSII